MEHNFLNLPSLFIVTLFLFLALKIKTSQNLPPGPWKLPLIGNLHNLIGSLPHRRLYHLAKKHGPIMHLQLGELSTIIISAPEAAEIFLKTQDAIFARRPQLFAAHILTYESTDIAFSHGSYWRQLRKICATKLLSPKRVKSFRSVREDEVQKLVESISTSSRVGSPVNLSEKISSLINGITGRAVFGKKCKAQGDYIECTEEMSKLARGYCPADLFPSVRLVRAIDPTGPKIERLHRRSDVILDAIINQRKGKLNAEEDDLVGVLLDLQEHGDLEFPLTDDNIKAVILDMFSAGSETSSTTVEWAMSEMIKNPRIMDKAQEEVRTVYNSTKGIVDESCLQELKFLKCVIKETLRLHPSGPFLLPRECQERCKVNGYDVPLKTQVIVNAWAIARDPRYWAEPDRFYPERFLDSAVDFRGTDFEFIPFGAGRRMCPGISFALPNVELPLANLLYHFDWKVGGRVKNEDLDMNEVFGATVRRELDLCLIPIAYRDGLHS